MGSVPCGNYNPTSSVLRCRRYPVCVRVHLGHNDIKHLTINTVVSLKYYYGFNVQTDIICKHIRGAK